VPRDFAGSWPDGRDSEPEVSEDARAALALLAARGASFATDMARALGQDPSRLRRALAELMSRGLVTNDRLDPLRAGGLEMLHALVEAGASGAAGGSPRRVRPRRVHPARPEGRWSVLEPAEASEPHLLAWISALLDRYGILTRDLVAIDPWAPPWAEIYPLLARAELRGELRRGYFVEGLSGVQYADEQAAEALARLAATPVRDDQDVLLAAGDPANLYGSGAPLDIPLLDGGNARLSRIPGNYLVLRSGRPVLVIEGGGKRLTGLASASQSEIQAALRRVVELSRSQRQVLKIDTYNGEPALSSIAAPFLAELGFVRDYPGMTYYAAWNNATIQDGSG
jgi:ATP-dependent Lhr-like helicase